MGTRLYLLFLSLNEGVGSVGKLQLGQNWLISLKGIRRWQQCSDPYPIYYLSPQRKQIYSIEKLLFYCMRPSSVYSSQNIKATLAEQKFSHKRRPSGFRVVMKNRSNGRNKTQSEANQDQKSIALTKTESSFHSFSQFHINEENDLNQTKQQLKSFAKSMNPNRIVIGDSPNENYKQPVKKMSVGNESKSNFYRDQRQSERSEERPRSRKDNLRPSDIALPNHISEPRLVKLQDLQKRLDSLIQMKLIKAQGSIKNGHKSKLSRVSKKQQNQDELEGELKQIIDAVMKIQQEGNDQTGLDSVNRKIMLLEKVMAESATESEMIKKYFYSKTTNRKVDIKKIYSSHQTMNLSTQQLTKKLRSTSRNGKSPIASVSHESICKSNYKAPKKQDYVVRVPKPEYLCNNQPLPRSSYGRDFLTYGTIPKFSYRHDSSNVMAGTRTALDKSCYRNDFTAKQPDRINFKELDCFKDKFRNLKISFIDKNRHLKTEQSESRVGKQKPQMEKLSTSKNRAVSQRIKTAEAHFIKDLKSQNGFNYVGEKPTIKSLIKHKNLQDLKYNFKASLHT